MSGTYESPRDPSGLDRLGSDEERIRALKKRVRCLNEKNALAEEKLKEVSNKLEHYSTSGGGITNTYIFEVFKDISQFLNKRNEGNAKT